MGLFPDKNHPLVQKLLVLPDKYFQGPLLKYKRKYRATVKRIRRGQSGVMEEAQAYGQPKVESWTQENISEKDIENIKKIIQKMTDLAIKVGGIIAKVVVGVAAYRKGKDVLTDLSKLSKKANVIAAASAVGPAGGPFAIIGWIKQFAIDKALWFSYTASSALKQIEKMEASLVKYASNIVDNFAQAIKHHFGANAAKAVRAEKWGTALHDDVVRTQKEADDAKTYADNQKNRFEIAALDAHDKSIMDEFDDIEIDEFDEDLYEDGELSTEETTDTTIETGDSEEDDTSVSMAGNYPFSSTNMASMNAFGSHINPAAARLVQAEANGYASWSNYVSDNSYNERTAYWNTHPAIW